MIKAHLATPIDDTFKCRCGGVLHLTVDIDHTKRSDPRFWCHDCGSHVGFRLARRDGINFVVPETTIIYLKGELYVSHENCRSV